MMPPEYVLDYINKPKLYVSTSVPMEDIVNLNHSINIFVMFQITNLTQKQKNSLTYVLERHRMTTFHQFDDTVICFEGIRLKNDVKYFQDIITFFNEHLQEGHDFGEIIYRKNPLGLIKKYFVLYDFIKECIEKHESSAVRS